jgi:hypothetical protein
MDAPVDQLWYRIMAAGMKGMTLADPEQGQPDTPGNAMAMDRFS